MTTYLVGPFQAPPHGYRGTPNHFPSRKGLTHVSDLYIYELGKS